MADPVGIEERLAKAAGVDLSDFEFKGGMYLATISIDGKPVYTGNPHRIQAWLQGYLYCKGMIQECRPKTTKSH